MFPGANDLTRARLLAFDDSCEFQKAKFRGFAGETFTDVHRIQMHGFSSHPPADAVGLMMRMGESDRMIALGFDTANRPRNLPAGGVALYDQHGNVLKMVNTGAEMDLPGKPLVIKCQSFRFEGPFGVFEGKAGGLFHNGKNVGDVHTHEKVTTGNDNTGPPNA